MLGSVSMVPRTFKYYEDTRQADADEALVTLWIVFIKNVVIVAAHFLILFASSAGEWIPERSDDSGAEERGPEWRACWESSGASRSFPFSLSVHQRFDMCFKLQNRKGTAEFEQMWLFCDIVTKIRGVFSSFRPPLFSDLWHMGHRIVLLFN